MAIAEIDGGDSRPPAPGKGTAWAPIVLGTTFAGLTGLIVALGGILAAGFFKAPTAAAARPDRGYVTVAARGYEGPGGPAGPAIFPALPLLGRLAAGLTDLEPAAALSVVANLAFWAAMVLMASRAGPGRPPSEAISYATLLMGLSPYTFFCRLPGPESMLLLIAVATLLGMERGWHPLALASLVGLGTATSPVGVGLTVPLFWHLATPRPGPPERAARLWLLAPVALWGIAAFMLYQGHVFNDPLAFARGALTGLGPVDCAGAIISLEPLWGTYAPGSPYYWQSLEPAPSLAFSLAAWGPVWFLACAGLMIWGRSRRHLSAEEVAMAVAFLLIAYVQAAFQPRPAALARSCALVVPAFTVLGRIFAGAPAYLAACLAGISGLMLGIESGLWAIGATGP